MKKLDFDFNGNMGGISRMFAIPADCFRRLRRNHSQNKVYLEVINRDEIIDIYFTEDSDNFSEDYNDGLYNVTVSAITPKSSPINSKNLKKLESEYWMVLFQDNNENVRLAGNPDYLLQFRRTDTTGNYSSRNQIAFSFYGAQTTACEFITLDDMDDL